VFGLDEVDGGRSKAVLMKTQSMAKLRENTDGLMVKLSIDVLRTCKQNRQPSSWFVVWNIFIFPYIGNVIIPTDFRIFQRDRSTTNQIFFSTRKKSDCYTSDTSETAVNPFVQS